jgi:hypothetical protein
MIKRLLTILAMTLSVLVPNFASAIPTTDENAVIQDSIYYVDNDSDVPCPTGSTPSSSAGSLAGADNRQKIWNWLRAKGLSAQQAAGVIGNMSVESDKFNPARNQDGFGLGVHAWGLAQWDGSRRDALLRVVKANPTTAPLYNIK